MKFAVSRLLAWGAVMVLLLPAMVMAASPIDGSWQGSLDLGAAKLRVVFNFSSDADGKQSGTLDSPDQGAFGIQLDTVTITNDTVRAEAKRISGVFEGKLLDDNKKLVGNWTQMGRSLRLTLIPQMPGERVVLKRPQEPAKPYPYIEEEVSY